MPEEKAKLVITTVGTSLIEKFDKSHLKIEGSFVPNKIYCSELAETIRNNCETKDTAWAENRYTEDQGTIKDALKLLNEKLTNPEEDLRHAPAEIASLWKLNLNKEKDKVVLLYSDTPEGFFCYRVLQLFLTHQGYKSLIMQENDITSNKVVGLQPYKLVDFLGKGLSNFQSIIKKLHEDFNSNYRLLVNFTAGYKGVIPWATIFAWNYDADLVYLYEESEQIIFLERPAGWIRISYQFEDHRNPRLIMEDVPSLE